MSYTRSRYNNRIASPQDSRRACLCADGETYSRECCDGELINQGIGSLEGQGSSDVVHINPANPDFDCSDLTLSGFAVSDQGVITLPTTSAGTIQSTSPSSFDLAGTNTERTLSVKISTPTGYTNSGGVITCTTTATQPAAPSLACEDITISGFSVAADGTVTAPTIDIGTISGISPSSFGLVDVSTLRTLNVDVTVPSGYFNEGSTLNCTTTATQPLTPSFTCTDAGASGFSISAAGVITPPTLAAGTVGSYTPTSFSGNSSGSSSTQSVTFTINVPAGYYNTGSTIDCTLSATQPTATRLWQKQIVPGSQSTNTVNVYGDSGLHQFDDNDGPIGVFSYDTPDVSGTNWTTISDPIYNVVGVDLSITGYKEMVQFRHFSSTPFTSVQTGTGNINLNIGTLRTEFTGGVYQPRTIYDTTNLNKSVYLETGLVATLGSESSLGDQPSDGYYAETNIGAQIRVQGGVITEIYTPMNTRIAP